MIRIIADEPNIEHVLHNIAEDLTDEEKEDLAFEIADRYSECPEDFLKLLYEGDFSLQEHIKIHGILSWKMGIL